MGWSKLKLFTWISALLILSCALCTPGALFAEVKQLPAVYATAVTSKVNIRSGQGLNFEILGQLNKYARVIVTGEEFGWYRVKLPQQAKCFVRQDYLNANVVATDLLRVRAGAGTNFNVLGLLKKGQTVRIIKPVGDWQMILPPEGCVGWIKKDYLRLSNQTVDALAPQAAEPARKQNKKLEISGVIDDVGKIHNRPGTHKLIIGKNNFYYLNSKVINLNQYVYQQVSVIGTSVDLKDSSHPVLNVEQVKVKQ
ncbi:SH3 domain-containing protein [Candidatus Omnitrophota bacterium]